MNNVWGYNVSSAICLCWCSSFCIHMVSDEGVEVLIVSCLGMEVVCVCVLVVETVCSLARLPKSTMCAGNRQSFVLEEALLLCDSGSVSSYEVRGSSRCPLLACIN